MLLLLPIVVAALPLSMVMVSVVVMVLDACVSVRAPTCLLYP